MNAQLIKLYAQFRHNMPFVLVGSNAKLALDSAKTLLAFREAESKGLVRMLAEPEDESYFQVYGYPDTKKEREEMERIIERDGCWRSASEWFDGDSWNHADSCGMHTGYSDPLDPFENGYIIQEMQAALDALAAHSEALCYP